MSTKFLAAAALALSLRGIPASAADIVGAWQIRGSVFFNAVVTICHFRAQDSGIGATCESDGALGPFTPATVDGRQVAWSWDSGPAVLTFHGTLTSDTTMKGDIKVRGFTGDFTATRQ
jgi:hypothetical protein